MGPRIDTNETGEFSQPHYTNNRRMARIYADKGTELTLYLSA